MKTTKTYTIDIDIAQKFKDQTPPRKTSQKLEELMKQHLEESGLDLEDNIEETENFENPIDLKHLTDKQKKLFYTIYENNYFGKNKAAIQKKAVNKHGVYSRTRNFKEGIKALTKSEDVPLTFKSSKVVSDKVRCPRCEIKHHLAVLSNNDGVCPSCEREDGVIYRFFKDGKVKA